MAVKLKKKESESIFYVGVKDPVELRRSILESSKEMLQHLQRADKFKEVREEKAAEISKLKVTMDQLNKLVRKLRLAMPKTGVRAAAGKKKETKHKKSAKAHKQEEVELTVEKPIQMSELEKLESELSEIEGRLTKLS